MIQGRDDARAAAHLAAATGPRDWPLEHGSTRGQQHPRQRHLRVAFGGSAALLLGAVSPWCRAHRRRGHGGHYRLRRRGDASQFAEAGGHLFRYVRDGVRQVWQACQVGWLTLLSLAAWRAAAGARPPVRSTWGVRLAATQPLPQTGRGQRVPRDPGGGELSRRGSGHAGSSERDRSRCSWRSRWCAAAEVLYLFDFTRASRRSRRGRPFLDGWAAGDVAAGVCLWRL